MQRSQRWWDSLSEEQQAAVLAMPSAHWEPWVLNSMEAAGIHLATAEMKGTIMRLPPTITTDYIESRRRRTD